MPNLKEERKLWRKGYKRVICVDEAGRGPLAGPVVAAAVMIKSKIKIQKSKLQFKIQNLKDSKKLSQKQREKFYQLIIKNPMIEWGIGKVSEKVIDKINILEATKLAMKRAIKNLEKKLKKQEIKKISDQGNLGLIDFLILDGKMKLDLPLLQKSIVRADEKVASCTLASILAKVIRDRLMENYHRKYPQYGFDKHKGYGTKYHLEMLKKFGQCGIHRKSFHYGSSKAKTHEIKKK